VGFWYRCHIEWIEASGKFGAVIQDSSPTMKNSKVVRIRRSDHACVSSHMLSDPLPSGRAVIRNIEVFSSANDAVVPIPETEGKYYEVPEAMEMSGCDNVFKVILTVHIDVEEVENKSRGSVMLHEARCLLLGALVVEVHESPIFILVSIFWKFVVEV
jgi:hypothetical protein